MLGQRRRRWTNIESTLGERLVFAGKVLMVYPKITEMCMTVMGAQLGQLCHI